ncbi:MAG TPA: hypothetical protein VHM88_23125 [Candidatus Acidoferrales bacterium]|nr:hypothetical protein [Candidatus Acidoferrales bacterium]
MSKKKAKSLLQRADGIAQRALRRVSEVVSPPGPLEPPITPSALEGRAFECFLCGGRVEIKISKKNRPYFHCLDCYVQCFIRGDAGIRRLISQVEGDQEEG